MDINVTRKYKGKKDSKGNIVPNYNYRGGQSTTNTVSNVLKTATITEKEYDNPLRTTLVDCIICINFKQVTSFLFVCPDDLVIDSQASEVSDALLFVDSSAYVLEELLPQFTVLTVTPSDLGVVILIGKMKSTSVKIFTTYQEVKKKSPFVYIAYASSATGADFTTDPESKLPYVATLISEEFIETPIVSDFEGLWRFETPLSHIHAIADVTGLQTALDNKINTSLIGVANGLAETDANNFVKNIHLPGYIDDVIDGFLISSTVFDAFETPHNPGGPVIPEGGKIYFDVYTNLQYRWSGTAFITTNSALALGETPETAYPGDRGKIAYDYSQIGHVTLADSRISQWEAAYTARITSLTNVGNSGAATLIGNVLNIPNYTLAGLGGAPAFSGTANYIPKFGSSGATLENSQFSHSSGGDYMILDNQYAGLLFKKSGVNKFIFGDDAFLTASRPNAYGFYLYGNNIIDFWANNTRIASFGQSSGIQFPSLAGTGMRLTTSSSNGTLANISNATGYLANDGSGNMSFGAITGFLPITGGELTGALIGTTANFSGAATAASFVFGTTGYSFEVVSGKLVIKYSGTSLMSIDTSGNLKVAGESYRGGL